MDFLWFIIGLTIKSLNYIAWRYGIQLKMVVHPGIVSKKDRTYHSPFIMCIGFEVDGMHIQVHSYKLTDAGVCISFGVYNLRTICPHLLSAPQLGRLGDLHVVTVVLYGGTNSTNSSERWLHRASRHFLGVVAWKSVECNHLPAASLSSDHVSS